MGRKAVVSLLFLLAVAFSCLLFAATLLSRHAAGISPAESDLWALMALLMPVFLAANFVLFVIWLVRRHWIVAIIPLAAILLNGGYIFSMVQLPQFGEDDSPVDLTVASLNVDGFRYQGNREYSVYTIASLARNEQADVVCLQEFFPDRKLTDDSIAAFFAPELPHFVSEGGEAIASRFPILDHGYVAFPDSDNDYLWVDLDMNGTRVRVFSVHLQTSGISGLQHRYRKDYNQNLPLDVMWDEMSRNNRIRAGQADEIRAVVDKTQYPVIFVGDFNETPSSYIYEQLKGDLTDGFRDAGHGYGGTFREMGGVLRIDFIFYDDSFGGVRYYTSPEEVSDHKMVIAKMQFKR